MLMPPDRKARIVGTAPLLLLDTSVPPLGTEDAQSTVSASPNYSITAIVGGKGIPNGVGLPGRGGRPLLIKQVQCTAVQQTCRGHEAAVTWRWKVSVCVRSCIDRTDLQRAQKRGTQQSRISFYHLYSSIYNIYDIS
jgi:hypothetical protein